MQTRLVIVTRYFPPIENGLAHHSAYLEDLLKESYDEVVIVCQTNEKRTRAAHHAKSKLVEFQSLWELFGILNTICRESTKRHVIVFQYVPHMWGRSGVAVLPSMLPLWVRLRHRTSVVSFLHELKYDWSLHPKRLLPGLVHRVQLSLIGVGSNQVIVTNDLRYRALTRRWRWFFANKVSRIPAGCISGRSRHTVSDRPNYPYITWFGTLSDDQKLEELVSAFCSASKDVPDLRLVIMGAFDWQAHRIRDIQSNIAKWKLGNRVLIRGFVDEEELGPTLAGSFANFHMAGSGPSGRRTVVAAYLKSGRALVAVDGHETDPEFIHGKNVYFVEPDASAIRDVIIRLWRDPNLRNKLASGSRRLYDQMYSDETIRHKLLRVLAGIAQSRTLDSEQERLNVRGETL
ncbi:glycosyltransferase family 4 protein [Alicyclobacillus fastidiosus]|uniref:Glycosyltransferase n=1 Tax=Alicyclobacillus fastidiosus TaxID=392011 RepID=A0ABV5AAY9_9BACL|nr:glycosyltransferase [Alicyclobacillus fastidiosus]WEH07625.1 glycosyltransferase [Alicyclobacillus fastidiosus]